MSIQRNIQSSSYTFGQSLLSKFWVEGGETSKTFWVVTGFTGAALLLRAILDPMLEELGTYITVLLSTVAVSIFAGFKAGVMASNLGTLLAFILFVYLPGRFTADQAQDYVLFLLALVFGYGTAFLACALREAERRLDAFLKNLPVLAWTKDARGQYVYANPEAEKVFNVPMGQLRGKTDSDIFPEDIATKFKENDLRVSDGRVALHTTENLRLKDGTQHHWLVTKFALPDPFGEFGSVGGVAQDISDRVRAEMAVATAAHELRNPISALLTGLALMERHGVPEKTRHLVTILERQSRSLSRLVDDMLQVSKVKTGKLIMKKEILDLRKAVKEAAEATSEILNEKKHSLSLEVPESELLIDGDPLRIHQILVNLLTNAAKYTNNGGKVNLSLSRVDGDAIISVRDNGIGIPRETLPRLFEPYFQIDGNSPGNTHGLGLGLPVVKQCIDLHGGTIKVASEGPGKGSCFTVALPLHKVEVYGKAV